MLHCPRCEAQWQETSDLIVQGDVQASKMNMLKEVGRLARVMQRTGRLGLEKGRAQATGDVGLWPSPPSPSFGNE